jgi:hypothetical protein
VRTRTRCYTRTVLAVPAQQRQMALSITRSAHAPIDYVRILGEVDLTDATQLGLAARQLIDANASTFT